MNYKNDTKKYLKFNLLAFLLLFLFSYSTIFIQKVNADTKALSAQETYKVAWSIINEKFYFKSKVNLNRWENKFTDKISDLSDAHKYINKLVTHLKDPYTRFLTREEFQDEQDFINSSLTGIGIKLAINEPVILDVLKDSPADKNGIKPDDCIIKVNNKSTRGLNSKEVAGLISGPKNSEITMKLKRDNEIITKSLKLEKLNYKSVSSKLLEDNIALIKIDSFIPENTSNIFKDEILKVMDSNGLIIDLRNNSGGLLKNAVEIADMFLSEGRIVSTIFSSAKSNEYANSATLYDTEVIILVNENTASASEILASALKENNRAKVIGKRTHGKGLVQEIVKLPDDSALHVTTAAYLTPNGKSIHKKGIVPDEIISGKDKQLERAKEILLRLQDKSRIASL